jgi:kynureninase
VTGSEFTSTAPEYAAELDASDELAGFRKAFVGGDDDLVYLNGNSLGRLPEETSEEIRRTLDVEWGQRLIRGWNEDWYSLSSKLGDKLAGIVGAEPGEVIVSDATSVNLFKLALAAIKLRGDRSRIVTDELNFPSDLYVLQGIVDLLGNRHEIRSIRSRDGVSIDHGDLTASIDGETCLVCLSHASYISGFLYNLTEVTKAAHQAGALVLWDLSHSVGVMPIDLGESGADLAVGCTYKYLNGGPGSPAFLYVRKDLQKDVTNPIWGWFAADRPFSFSPDFKAASGMRRYLVGTPPILSMKAVGPAVDLILDAGLPRLRAKSIHLTDFIVHLTRNWLFPSGFELASPLDSDCRGSHVSLRHPEAYRISRALLDENLPGPVVVADFREPDFLRLGVAPIYNSFFDVHRALRKIRWIVGNGAYVDFAEDREEIT